MFLLMFFSSYCFIVIIIALFLVVRVLLLLCLDFVDIAVVCLFDVCLLGLFLSIFKLPTVNLEKSRSTKSLEKSLQKYQCRKSTTGSY